MKATAHIPARARLSWLGLGFLLLLSRAARADDPRDELFNVSGLAVEVPAQEGDGGAGPITVTAGTSRRICAQQPVEYVRLKLHGVDLGAQVSVRAYAQDAEQIIEPSVVTADYWTRRVRSRCAVVSVRSGTGAVVVDQLLVPVALASPKSYFPEGEPPNYKSPSLAPTAFRPLVRTASRLTALLAFMRKDQEVTCTAWFLSKTFLITNFHCVESDARARNVAIDVGVFEDTMAAVESFAGAGFVVGSSDLDYAVLELDQPSTAVPTALPWRKTGPDAGESIVVVQHPGGRPIRGAWDGDCRVQTARVAGRNATPDVDFGHRCDTEGGSSGSIVVSQRRGCPQVIGLHHWGVEAYTSTSQNQGVRIERIYDDLVRRATGAGAEAENAGRVIQSISTQPCG
jgi:V8-like Glu-specific endopeptidase